MTTRYAIGHAIQLSIKQHIDNLWGGDLYDSDGNLTQAAFCPSGYDDVLSYTDKNGEARVFGPSSVTIGRMLGNVTNIPKNTAVPSAFIEIAPNDFDKVEDWYHSVYSSIGRARTIPRVMTNSPNEVGAGTQMYRRFIIKMTTYFINSKQSSDDVDRLGNAASSLLETMLTSSYNSFSDIAWNMQDESGVLIVDPFGESPWRSYPVITHSRRRGGPPKNYIWDIKIYLEVATFRSDM